MTLDPRRLRLLADLAALGTVRAVAAHGNLSASAVSQQLGVLERETRTPLLERTGRRVRLTAAGVILARRAREILASMDAAEAELRGLGDEPAGTVTLAVFQSAVHALAVPAVARLAQRHPDLDVVIQEAEPHDSMRALRRGDVDVIVTTTDFVGAELDPAIDLVPIGADAIVAVLPPGVFGSTGRSWSSQPVMVTSANSATKAVVTSSDLFLRRVKSADILETFQPVQGLLLV